MSVTAAASIISDPNTDTSGASRVPSKTLNQNDFLKLLVAQMSAQDPMNPQSNTDFAAQMAQFTALQTAQQTDSDIVAMRGDQQVFQASAMMGQTVTVQATPTTTVTGTVSGVQINNGVPSLMVNGQAYTLSQVLSVAPPAGN